MDTTENNLPIETSSNSNVPEVSSPFSDVQGHSKKNKLTVMFAGPRNLYCFLGRSKAKKEFPVFCAACGKRETRNITGRKGALVGCWKCRKGSSLSDFKAFYIYLELRGVIRVEGNNDENYKLIFHDVSGEKEDKIYQFYNSNKNLTENNNPVYPVDDSKIKSIKELKKIYQCSYDIPGYGNQVDENMTTLDLYNLSSNGNKKRKRNDDESGNRRLTSFFHVYNTDVGFKPLEKEPTLEDINHILQENFEFKKSFNSIFKTLAESEENLNILKNKIVNNSTTPSSSSSSSSSSFTNTTTTTTSTADIKNKIKSNKKEKAVAERRQFIKKLMDNGSERIRSICEEVEELFNNTNPNDIPEGIKTILKMDGGIQKIQESIVGLTTRSRGIIKPKNLVRVYIKGLERQPIRNVRETFSIHGINNKYIKNISFINRDICEITTLKIYEKTLKETIQFYNNINSINYYIKEGFDPSKPVELEDTTDLDIGKVENAYVKRIKKIIKREKLPPYIKEYFVNVLEKTNFSVIDISNLDDDEELQEFHGKNTTLEEIMDEDEVRVEYVNKGKEKMEEDYDDEKEENNDNNSNKIKDINNNNIIYTNNKNHYKINNDNNNNIYNNNDNNNIYNNNDNNNIYNNNDNNNIYNNNDNNNIYNINDSNNNNNVNFDNNHNNNINININNNDNNNNNNNKLNYNYDNTTNKNSSSNNNIKKIFFKNNIENYFLNNNISSNNNLLKNNGNYNNLISNSSSPAISSFPIKNNYNLIATTEVYNESNNSDSSYSGYHPN